MHKSIIAISALTLGAISSPALADDGSGWSLHGFGDISVKNDYVTPRGLVVTTSGATVQVLNGLVFVSPGGVAIHAGTWTDINPHSPSKSLILLSGSQYFRYKSWC